MCSTMGGTVTVGGGLRHTRGLLHVPMGLLGRGDAGRPRDLMGGISKVLWVVRVHLGQ